MPIKIMNLLQLLVLRASIGLATNCSRHQYYDLASDSCLECSVIHPRCFTCEIALHNLVTDGGFEDHDLPNSVWGQSAGNLKQWKYTGNGNVVYVNDNGGTDIYFGWGGHQPTIWQPITRPVPGYSYTLAFWRLTVESTTSLTFQGADPNDMISLPFPTASLYSTVTASFTKDWTELHISATGRVRLYYINIRPDSPKIEYEITYYFAPSADCDTCTTHLCQDYDCSFSADNPSPAILKCFGEKTSSGFSPNFCTKLTD